MARLHGFLSQAHLAKAVAGVSERPSVYQDLDQIELPVLIINGQEDAVYPPAVGRRMQEQIPEAELVIIPGAGHSSSVEAPAAVTAAIASFLDEQTP